MVIANHTFLYPSFLLLILLPLALKYLLSVKNLRTNNLSFYFPNLAYLNKLRQQKLHKKSKSSTNFLLLYLTWILLNIALATPVKINEAVPQNNLGYDIIIVIDTSLSMNALDFSSEKKLLTRLDVVKDKIMEFVAKRKNDHIGLIIFGDYPVVESPLTSDNVALNEIISQVNTATVGQATAIGDAIILALKKLQNSPNDSSLIILLTDGKNSAGKFTPLAAANIAKEKKIPIHTIGIGSNKIVPYIDLNGRISQSYMEFDSDTLYKIANITGGKYYFADNSANLAKIYNEIDKLNKYEFTAQKQIYYKHYYQFFILIALVTWLLLLLRLSNFNAISFKKFSS